jgi:hypothetical protein
MERLLGWFQRFSAQPNRLLIDVLKWSYPDGPFNVRYFSETILEKVGLVQSPGLSPPPSFLREVGLIQSDGPFVAQKFSETIMALVGARRSENWRKVVLTRTGGPSRGLAELTVVEVAPAASAGSRAGGYRDWSRRA